MPSILLRLSLAFIASAEQRGAAVADGPVCMQLQSLSHVDGLPIELTLSNLCLDGHLQDAGLDSLFSHILKLDLSGNSITGTIDFGTANDWPHLEYLDLSGNKFQGIIPTVFDELPLLRHLRLADCGFVGDVLNDWAPGCVLQVRRHAAVEYQARDHLLNALGCCRLCTWTATRLTGRFRQTWRAAPPAW